MSLSLSRFGALAISGLFIALMALSSVHAQEENAALRVVHAVPDGPAVDVYLDGTSVAENVAFFTASDYLPVTPGEHLVQVSAAGAQPGDAVISSTLNFASGQEYTLAATGMLDTIQATVLEDDRVVSPAGDTKIRFIHAIPGAPAVDIRLVGQDVPLINNLAFQEASDYLPLLPGDYAFNVVAVGQSEPILDFNETLLADEPIYDVFLVGALPDIRAEVVGTIVQVTPPQPTPQVAVTAPAAQPTATTQPAATTQATAAAQPTAAPVVTAQATVAGQFTAQPAATAQPTATAQTPSQLPQTGVQSGSPLTLLALAVLLIGGGLFVLHRNRAG